MSTLVKESPEIETTKIDAEATLRVENNESDESDALENTVEEHATTASAGAEVIQDEEIQVEEAQRSESDLQAKATEEIVIPDGAPDGASEDIADVIELKPEDLADIKEKVETEAEELAEVQGLTENSNEQSVDENALEPKAQVSTEDSKKDSNEQSIDENAKEAKAEALKESSPEQNTAQQDINNQQDIEAQVDTKKEKTTKKKKEKTEETSDDSDSTADEEKPSRSRALLLTSLLSTNKPISKKELKKVLKLSEKGVLAAIEDLKTTLYEQDLGLMMEEVAGGYRVIIQPTLYNDLAELIAPPPLPQLSSAALETLAIVSYKQPITRGELEAARGTGCSSTLDTLQERDLIKIVGQKDVVGKPLLYATTERFLLEFGLKSLEDLPPLDEKPTEFLRS